MDKFMFSHKYFIKICLAAVIMISVLLLLTGCIPNNYTAEEEAAFLKEAGAVISDYLEVCYEGAEVTEIQPKTSVDEGGYILTSFADGQFVWQNQAYDFLVDVETGEIFTSIYLDEIVKRLHEEILQGFGIEVQEDIVWDYSIRYLQGSKLISDSTSYYNVFPEGETADELIQKVLQNPEEYRFSMRIQYKGQELPQEIMDQESPIPTLSNVTFYHVAEEYSLYEGKYEFSVLPSLSEEILEFSQDASTYIRNQVLERDGLLLVYNAYERTRKDGVITERVITEEDISLTVTEESIALECDKDNYSMYLFAADKKTAEKYLYTLDHWIRKSGEFENGKGMWYAFEDRYVFSDSIYVETPHKFNKIYFEQNTIYTKRAVKEQVKDVIVRKRIGKFFGGIFANLEDVSVREFTRGFFEGVVLHRYSDNIYVYR